MAATMNKKSDDIRGIAKNMRQSGRSYSEISKALGVAPSTLSEWAKAGEWPDPRPARQKAKQAVKQAVAAAFDPSVELDPALFAPEKLEKIAENVIRYALKALLALPTGQNLKAVLDASVRLYLSKEEEKQIRQFEIYVPAQRESYPPKADG